MEVLSPQEIGGGRDGLHFGMGRNVPQLFGKVVGAGNDPVIYHNDRPHGHLAFFVSCLGLLQGLLHKIGVVQGEFHTPKNTILGMSFPLFEF